MITKIAEYNMRVYEWLGALLIGLVGFIFLGQNKRLDKNDNQTAKNTSNIQELRHDIKDIKKSLDIISSNLSKLDSYTHVWENINKRFDSLETKIDNKK